MLRCGCLAESDRSTAIFLHKPVTNRTDLNTITHPTYPLQSKPFMKGIAHLGASHKQTTQGSLQDCFKSHIGVRVALLYLVESCVFLEENIHVATYLRRKMASWGKGAKGKKRWQNLLSSPNFLGRAVIFPVVLTAQEHFYTQGSTDTLLLKLISY